MRGFTQLMEKTNQKFMKLSDVISSLAVVLLLAACTDPTIVGGSLLDQDKADVGFNDTLTIRATTITNDSIRT